MAFGGFFGGGGGSDKDSSSSSSPSNSSSSEPSTIFSAPSSTHNFPTSTTPSSRSPSQTLTHLQSTLSTQSNIVNAKYLIQKVNENCFNTCIPNPGSSLSSKESTCLSACMEKYIEGWNVVSRTYVGRLQREGASMGGMGAAPGQSL